MPTTEKPRPQPAAPDVLAFLAGLKRGGALSSSQVQRLLASWESLEDDWASSPFFRNVGEHSRAHIDQLSRDPSDLNPSDPQRRPISHG